MTLRENCIICEKPLRRVANKGSPRLRRGKRAVTCSKECSRLYIRISAYVAVKMRKRLKEFIDHLKQSLKSKTLGLGYTTKDYAFSTEQICAEINEVAEEKLI